MSPARDGLLFTHGYVYDRDPATAVERLLDLCARVAATDPPGGYDGHATLTVDEVLRAVATPKVPPVERVVSASYVLKFDYRSDGGPRLVGPFESRQAAFDYADRLHLENAEYCIRSVTLPASTS